jgi:hypothetical protein
MTIEPRLARLPEGTDADVTPTYYVTFLYGSTADGDDFGAEATYRFDGQRDVLTVVEWARQNMPDDILLAEVTAARRGDEADNRIRVWVHQPDTAWARRVGPDYTY